MQVLAAFCQRFCTRIRILIITIQTHALGKSWLNRLCTHTQKKKIVDHRIGNRVTLRRAPLGLGELTTGVLGARAILQPKQVLALIFLGTS